MSNGLYNIVKIILFVLFMIVAIYFGTRGSEGAGSECSKLYYEYIIAQSNSVVYFERPDCDKLVVINEWKIDNENKKIVGVETTSNRKLHYEGFFLLIEEK